MLLYAFQSEQVTTFPVSAAELKTGDIIVRRSHGLISNWFAEMSQTDKRYSHAGIVIKDHDQVNVISCNHEVNGLQLETVETFTSPHVCGSYGIYRFSLSEAERNNLHGHIYSDLHKKITFDDAFMLNNGSAFYCTEYIRDCFISLHNDRLNIPLSEVNKWYYVAVDDLYLNSGAQLLIARTNSNN